MTYGISMMGNETAQNFAWEREAKV